MRYLLLLAALLTVVAGTYGQATRTAKGPGFHTSDGPTPPPPK